MFKKLSFILIYFFTWTLFFEGARLLFLLYQFSETTKLSAKTIVLSFIHGLRMDFSMAAYITLPVCMFLLLALFVSLFRTVIPYLVYGLSVLVLTVLLLLTDLETFKAWGFRLDATPLKYLASPKEAWASISHLPLFWIFTGLGLFCFLLFWCSLYYFKKLIPLVQINSKRLLQCIFILLTAGLLIIPMRGGFGLAPMNESGVYFSDNHFANLAAVNAPWNFLHALSNKGLTEKNPYPYMEERKAKSIVDGLYRSSGHTKKVLSRGKKPNVIIIIWESFTEKATGVTINGREVTPHFNGLKREGIYFSNAYASGDRTDKGISAISSGYPALPKMSIIRFPSKTPKLPSLGNVFKEQGYYTSFYYGGETEFANIKSYLLHSRFDKLMSKADFSKRNQNSKWGVHDGVVAQQIIRDGSTLQQPFFTTWLTLTSHEPFETPVSTVFPGKDEATKFLNSLHYTDSCIYEFVSHCKKQPWWNNTVLIIIADHGHRYPETENKIDEFKIPLLWLGGALTKTNYTVDRVVSQLDIAATLLHEMNIANSSFPFSKVMFDSLVTPWAFLTYNNAFGFVEKDGSVIFDNVGKNVIEQKGVLTESSIEKGKALQQTTYEDFLRK